ncbi:aldo/keto reductase [Gryllotalpicola protaetiae]|uniref:Aldo/keto reductase n=1 Tax=Gryllotalpicola protaetiae TaxID=2419771 RepID=A0A387BUV5_9MICO|nr:aldo/keto reductase [Gryllotalpicola protaetiae]AYG02211.1 aldo/keto reductase [Gryllotalpicola protaetiae]
MDYRQLGSSGLRISSLTLGTMGYGGTGWATPVGNLQVDDVKRQLGLAKDAGVNIIDTADVYSNGLSEQLLGEALGDSRDEWIVATKVRMAMGEGPNDAGASRHHIITGAEDSLRRLGTDYIDLYQLHEWDGQTPLEETWAALDHLVQSGKVRYLGISNYTGWQTVKAVTAAERHGFTKPVATQVHYSPQTRDIEGEVIPAAIDQGLGILVWSPLAGGLLSGKYRRGQDAPEGSRRFQGWTEPPVYDEALLYDLIDLLVEIGDGHGVSAAQVALAWTLGRPQISSLIIAGRTDEQLSDNLAAASLVLTDDERARIDQLTLPDLRYPFWHQRNTSTDRLSPADWSLIKQYV